LSPLAEFILYFLIICAVTALVNSMIQEGRPRVILRHGLQFFLLIVVGILVFSVIAYLLESGQHFSALIISTGILVIYLLTRIFSSKQEETKS